MLMAVPIIAVGLSSSSMASAVTADDEVIADAIELLRREIALVPQASPANADTEGFDEARRELGAVERQGALILAELEARDVELTDEITRALSAPVGAAGERPAVPPPPPDVYAVAVQDLIQLATAADAPTESSSWPVAAVVGAVMVAVAAAVLGAVQRTKRRMRYQSALSDSLTDPLTEAGNRRRLDRDLDRHGEQSHGPVAVLMIDIDHFKGFNDRHGHSAGDDVLQAVTGVIARHLRADDVVYRYGGEEFCVLLPGARTHEAEAIAERIRTAVAAEDPAGGERVTVSIGLSTGAAQQARATLRSADAALYEAKRSGRNRTVVRR